MVHCKGKEAITNQQHVLIIANAWQGNRCWGFKENNVSILHSRNMQCNRKEGRHREIFDSRRNIEWGSTKEGLVVQAASIRESIQQKVTLRLEGVSTLPMLEWRMISLCLESLSSSTGSALLVITPIELHQAWASRSQIPLHFRRWVWVCYAEHGRAFSRRIIAHTKAEGRKYTRSLRAA